MSTHSQKPLQHPRNQSFKLKIIETQKSSPPWEFEAVRILTNALKVCMESTPSKKDPLYENKDMIIPDAGTETMKRRGETDTVRHYMRY